MPRLEDREASCRKHSISSGQIWLFSSRTTGPMRTFPSKVANLVIIAGDLERSWPTPLQAEGCHRDLSESTRLQVFVSLFRSINACFELGLDSQICDLLPCLERPSYRTGLIASSSIPKLIPGVIGIAVIAAPGIEFTVDAESRLSEGRSANWCGSGGSSAYMHWDLDPQWRLFLNKVPIGDGGNPPGIHEVNAKLLSLL